MNPQCARCGRVVYPTEKVNCLDKYWHKGCFHCEICKMTLNMNNYKGYDKKPYCNAHYPKQSFTTVADTPENLRLKQQSEIQSQVKYKRDFEESKGRGFSIVTDTPELQRLKKTQEQISNIKYHEDFEKTKGRGFTPIADDPVTERVRKNSQIVSDAAYKGVHPHVVETDRRPGIVVDLKVWRTDPGSIFDIDPLEDNIQSRSLRMLTERASLGNRQSCCSAGAARVSQADDRSEVSEMKSSISYYSEGTKASEDGAPVHPGAYHPSQSQGFGYMNQSSMSSMRSMHSPHSPSPSLRTFRAMYDYSAQDDDEVSFRDGDYIVNVQPIDEGWMYGTVQRTGKTGMLPANYIEPVN
ncbi:nebulette isoform X3 [Ranitomeya variabilis]|uniref:nebulette isoform X3 n=1 Tax=Ranitomeya variabilis TaxID=490064 RepID=UPI004056FBFC